MSISERLFLAVAFMTDRKRRQEKGAAMVEYGLLIAFIAVIALVAVKLLGTNISTLFSGISF